MEEKVLENKTTENALPNGVSSDPVSDIADSKSKQASLKNRKLIPFFVIFGVFMLGFAVVIPNNLSKKPTITPTVIPSVKPKPIPTYFFIRNLEDALKHPDQAKQFNQLCDKNLATISPAIGGLTQTEFLDLSENNLTALPSEISKMTSLTELALVENNISNNEQLKIQQLLPNTKIAFVPQKDFNPYISDKWKTYTNTKYGFSFKYHPDLKITENEKGIAIKNELADFKYAYLSCSVEKAFINLIIVVEDNPNDYTPVQYLENAWKINITQQGEKYLVNEEQRMHGMIGKIENYKNGDIVGLIADAGESEHPRIVAVHNHKTYIFQYLPGGETGSAIGDIPKTVLNQSLATFKYSN